MSDDAEQLLDRVRERESRGDWAGIVEVLSGASPDALIDEPELGFLHATALRRVGEWQRAYDLTRALEPALARQGRDRLARRRLNLEAALHFDRGRIGEAADRFTRVIDAAAAAGDDRMLTDACNNYGIACTLLARTDEALASYNRALAVAQRLGARRALAQAHHNLAISYRELGFLDEAGEHFARAISQASLIGAEDIIGRAEEERALCILQAGDARLAESGARRALDRFRRTGDRAGEGEALRVLGIVALTRHDDTVARRCLDEALEIARDIGAPLLHAETLEARAAVRERAGATDEASADREAAERIFGGMGAVAWGLQVRDRLRSLV